MRFLHASDLHIGKKIDGISRIDEQREVLFEIAEIAQTEKVDAVLIAGDVFDTFVPSAEAEGAFFDFASDLAAEKIAVVVISGNHDDEDRLLASKNLASKFGVLLCGSNNENFVELKCGKLTVKDAGEYRITLSKGEEKVFIITLPYFSETPHNRPLDRNKTYSERFEELLNEVISENKQKYPTLLLSHVFMLGGQSTEGERSIDLGGAKLIPPSVIPDSVLYTALGHLHKRQSVKKDRNVIYSGSPLQYSYDESGDEKSVTLFDVSEGKITQIKKVIIKGGKRLADLSATGIENADEILALYREYHVRLTIVTDKPLTAEEFRYLKEKYPNVTEIRLALTGESQNRITGRKYLGDNELFSLYVKERFGSEPDDDLMAAFKEIMAEE